jgi:hypothetical protein
MKHNKNKGIGLIWVVAILAMIPVILAVLSANTLQLINETGQQIASAEADNLLLSASSWASANSACIINSPENHIITPDLSILNIPDSISRIKVCSKSADQAEIHISVEVHHPKGAWRLEKTLWITLSQ